MATRRRIRTVIIGVAVVAALCAVSVQDSHRVQEYGPDSLLAAVGNGGGARGRVQSKKEYTEAAGFLQPLQHEPEKEQSGQLTFDGPGSFGSEQVYPAKQVFHSYAVFGSKNYFGELNHFKEGSHFEEDNTFEQGASFGKETHFGVRLLCCCRPLVRVHAGAAAAHVLCLLCVAGQ